MTTLITALSEITDRYDAVLCDLWGVFHNGVAAHPAAITALQAYRARGGVVVFLTNAPRPASAVAKQLKGLGTPPDCYDRIVSSGDVTQAALASGEWGRRVYFIGAERDRSFFDGLDVTLATLEDAEVILCTGLRDDSTETPDDYTAELARGVARGLPMLSANPDIVVDRGAKRLWCGGALAQAYEGAGGRAVAFGKPHPPIYTHALAVVDQGAGAAVDPARVLAIGDGPATDLPGAADAGLDALFISGGLAAAETLHPNGAVDAARLHAYLSDQGAEPLWTMAALR